MGAGLRPGAKAPESPPDPNVGAPALDSTHSDLSRLIRGQFDKHGISYDCTMPLQRLTARYFEMSMRRIQPDPWTVRSPVCR